MLFLVMFLLAAMMVSGQEQAFRQVQDTESLTAKIAASSQDIQTLQCDFVQEKALSFLEEKVYSTGQFYFQKENKIRWEYEVPYSYIIIMNGSLIRIEDEGKANTLDASSSRLFSSINTIMAGIIDGSVIRQQDQFRSVFFENEKMVRVSLVPLVPGMKDFIGSIELDLNTRDYTVDALKIIEMNGDHTLISFKEKQFNEAIPGHIFRID